MLIEGQKWACEACIRGHRVSGCTHADRELKPIAKKGRPVSQCPHCRQLRKSRSAHVKCECGEKFLSRKDSNATKSGGPGGGYGGDKSAKSTAKECSCCTGGRCICSLKKESTLNTVAEIPNDPSVRTSSVSSVMTESRRPRLQSTQSESSLTMFANGHHKPTHKHHGVHGSSPYIIPGHSAIADTHNRHSFLDSEEAKSKHQPKPRRIRSEHSSPDVSLAGIQTSDYSMDPSPLELTPDSASNRPALTRLHTGLSVNTSHTGFTLHDYSSQELLLSAASDTHQFSSGFQPSGGSGWPSLLEDSANQLDDSATPFDWLSYPGFASSSSGDENDDLTSVRTTTETLYGNSSMGGMRSDASDLADNEGYRVSAASSFICLPQLGLSSGNRTDELGWLDFTLMGPIEPNASIERFLADYSPKQAPYGLIPGTVGDSANDDGSLFDNECLNQPLHSSTDDFGGIFASNMQSPIDKGNGGQAITDDDGIYMRSWNTPNY